VRSHLSVVQTLCKTYIEVKYLVLHGNIQFKRIGTRIRSKCHKRHFRIYPSGAACVAMIIGGIDLIMLLSDFIEARREKRIAAAAAEAKAEGKAEVYREIAAWEHRRKEAEARGEEFTEPPPTKPQEKSKD